ncbi:unnamed protein product, partial [marine sediment metagenome]
ADFIINAVIPLVTIRILLKRIKNNRQVAVNR